MNKKKVLISQPMRGLSTEQIKANREQAVETVITNGCEVLDSIFDFDDIENIKNKAISLELSFAKYVAMIEDGMPATDIYEKIDFDFSQLEAELSERIEKEKQRKADEQRELERQKLIMRENEERLAKQAEELKQRELEQKQREEEELKQSVLEKKTLEVQGLTKITMTVTYEKTPENSQKLNDLLTQMKEIADVKLEK